VPAALIPAILWTRSDIRDFKDSLRKSSENQLRVGSLSVATVRCDVPMSQ